LENLKPQKYWESDNQKIIDIAKYLKTPDEIYNFVTKTLTYNFDKVRPDVERIGALGALSKTNDAICTEFTDLFIALSRASGTPAREINGYAHSDNPNLQPLSLISDVLHAWPEYWDEDKQNWIPVDPTWESTSKIDYFNKFDLNHIAFVIHGKSSTEPLSAGSYKTESLSKDIFVEISQLPPENKKSLEINHEVINTLNPFKKKLKITFKNNKSSAYYNLPISVEFPESETMKEMLSVLPPYATHNKEIKIKTGLFAINVPNSIKITTEDNQKTINLNKTLLSIQQLLMFLTTLIIILVFVGIKAKKIQVNKHLSKYVNILKNALKIKKKKV
jgi:hypothetical protein